MNWVKGQRVVSQTEPELGCGIIVSTGRATIIKVDFPDKGETRQYGISVNLPVQRYVLKAGDKTKTASLGNLVVESLEQAQGVIYYVCGNQKVCESDIVVDALDQGPLESFQMKLLTPFQTFDLRREAWEIKGKINGSWVNGLVGARIKPLPHQLFVARTLSDMANPRAILSDEVGLGKTIEAGLVMNMIRRTQTNARVLVLVPDSLKHQWLSEMFRRFSELFAVIDEERCEEELLSQDQSAFSMNQTIIATSQLFENRPDIFEQAKAEPWDLIVVDEAHHLEWSQEMGGGRNWQIVKGLSENTKGLLLLTATPQVAGPEGFFGLLNLVDSMRFPSFDKYGKESKNWKEMAILAKSIHDGTISNVPVKDREKIIDDKAILLKLKSLEKDGSSQEIINDLVDRHGTGRVYFRNRRERLQGFPVRSAKSWEIESSGKEIKYSDCNFEDTKNFKNNIVTLYASFMRRSFDLKWTWFVEFCRALKGEKALVIVSSKETVLQIKSAWESQEMGSLCVFHDGLKVIERDIQAAKFMSDQDTKILVCSEIGGEGRNFQFVKKLVLFDMPIHPDLLEQRIGRLDRIGQGSQIEIHIPWVKNSPEEVLYSWYSKGMHSFETAWNGADRIFSECKEELFETMICFTKKEKDHDDRQDKLNKLIDKTVNLVKRERKRLKESTDILVDINSFNQIRGDDLVQAVEDFDDDPSMELLFRNMLNFYGVEYEDLDKRGSLKISGGALGFIEDFPGLRKDQDSLFCFDRDVALHREEMNFLSIEHPITEELLDFLLNRGEGVSSWAMMEGAGGGFLIQFSFVQQVKGITKFKLDKYLPPQAYLITIDENGNRVNDEVLIDSLTSLSFEMERTLESAWPNIVTKVEEFYLKAQSEALDWSKNTIQKALKLCREHEKREFEREEALLGVQGNLPENFYETKKSELSALSAGLAATQPRLDSLRLIIKAP